MSEDLSVAAGTKEDQYKSLLPQIKALITGESDLIANMGNITAALKEQFDWLWVGFYLVKNDELVLGPFQGPIACTRIKKGRGVCGTAWANATTCRTESCRCTSCTLKMRSACSGWVFDPFWAWDRTPGISTPSR